MDYIKCDQCAKQLKAPLKFCKNGHVTCSSCQQQECYCGLPYESITIKAIDNFLAEHKPQCRGKINGCLYVSDTDDVTSHEETCYFLRQTQCYIYGCARDVLVCKYDEHVRTHSHHMSNISMKKLHITIDHKEWRPLRTSLLIRDNFNHLYECNYKCTDDNCLVSIRYLGSKDHAQYIEVKVSIRSMQNEMKTVCKPHAFDTVEENLWNKPNFILTKQQCETFFSSGLLIIEVVRNPGNCFPVHNPGLFGSVATCPPAPMAFGSQPRAASTFGYSQNNLLGASSADNEDFETSAPPQSSSSFALFSQPGPAHSFQ